MGRLEGHNFIQHIKITGLTRYVQNSQEQYVYSGKQGVARTTSGGWTSANPRMNCNKVKERRFVARASGACPVAKKVAGESTVKECLEQELGAHLSALPVAGHSTTPWADSWTKFFLL